ncbi:MAG: MoaD/ThiS family protein [Synergistaceae bacterium]|jgi:molybdopterin converting factor small subunit|nr:MoaD/ThiS family protein [Synergistaceae bacterium]
MVRILMYGELEELSGTREIGMAGSRVLDVLVSLSSLYGEAFRELVLGGTGVTRVAILVNGAPVRHNVFEAPLRDGDVLSLMPLGDWDE